MEYHGLPIVTFGSDVAFAFFYESSRKFLTELSKNPNGISPENLAQKMGYTGNLNYAIRNIIKTHEGRNLAVLVDGQVVPTKVGSLLGEKMLPEEFAHPFMKNSGLVAENYILTLMVIYAGYCSYDTMKVVLGKPRKIVAHLIQENKSYKHIHSCGPQVSLTVTGKGIIRPIYEHIQPIEDILHPEKIRKGKTIKSALYRIKDSDPIAAKLLGLKTDKKDTPDEEKEEPDAEDLKGIDVESRVENDMEELCAEFGIDVPKRRHCFRR